MRPLLLPLLMALYTPVTAQYKNDNTLYKTVYLEDLCTTLEKNPGYLVLDVRTKGEYADTSHFPGANIGYFENAINIDIRDLDKRFTELSAYKNKPIFVVCSHSQRSRRASALLAENGYTKVYNINEGLTGVNLKKADGFSCASALYGTKNPFTFISPAKTIELLGSPGKAMVFDIRNDSAIKGFAANERLNAFGLIKGTIPISSQADLDQKLLLVPKKKTIILVDDFGEDATVIASIIAGQGFTDVRVLLEGMEKWMSTAPADCPGKMDHWIRNTPYAVITIPELQNWLNDNPGYLMVDVRDAEVFANKSKEAWQNKGHIKTAINIPAADMAKTAASWTFPKNRPILLYHFFNQAEVFNAARILANKGFTKVVVMSGGLFNLRWQAANIKGRDRLFDLVEDIPPGGF